MIKIRQPKDSEAKLFDGNDKFLGLVTTDIQLCDIRTQIKQQELKGHYLLWINKKDNDIEYQIFIDHEGYLSDHPNGFFELYTNYLMELAGWNEEK